MRDAYGPRRLKWALDWPVTICSLTSRATGELSRRHGCTAGSEPTFRETLSGRKEGFVMQRSGEDGGCVV
jgi:hypothetical protein